MKVELNKIKLFYNKIRIYQNNLLSYYIRNQKMIEVLLENRVKIEVEEKTYTIYVFRLYWVFDPQLN